MRFVTRSTQAGMPASTASSVIVLPDPRLPSSTTQRPPECRNDTMRAPVAVTSGGSALNVCVAA